MPRVRQRDRRSGTQNSGMFRRSGLQEFLKKHNEFGLNCEAVLTHVVSSAKTAFAADLGRDTDLPTCFQFVVFTPFASASLKLRTEEGCCPSIAAEVCQQPHVILQVWERIVIAIKEGSKVLPQPLWDAFSKRMGDGGSERPTVAGASQAYEPAALARVSPMPL